MAQVEQPLCVDCAGKVKEEVDAALKEAEREVAAYQAALSALQARRPSTISHPPAVCSGHAQGWFLRPLDRTGDSCTAPHATIVRASCADL